MKFFKVIFVFSLCLVNCFAYGNGGSGNERVSLEPTSSAGSGGGGNYGFTSVGRGVSLGNVGAEGDITGPISFSGPSSGGGGGGNYQAAIFTKHTVETRPVVTNNEQSQPAIINVDGGELPLEIVFRSVTSRLKVRQQHSPGNGGQIQETSSEEQPSILRHTVRKPVIQEIRELITPMRRVIQEIYPVQEIIETIIARSQPQSSGQSVAVEPSPVAVQSLAGGQSRVQDAGVGLVAALQTSGEEGQRRNTAVQQDLDGRQSLGQAQNSGRGLNRVGRQNLGRRLNLINRQNLGSGNNFVRESLGREQNFGGGQVAAVQATAGGQSGLGGEQSLVGGQSLGGGLTFTSGGKAINFDINNFFGLSETNSGSIGKQSAGDAYASAGGETAPSNDGALPLSTSVQTSSGSAGGTKGAY